MIKKLICYDKKINDLSHGSNCKARKLGGGKKIHVTFGHLPSAWTKNAKPSRIFVVFLLRP
jgi:hypothetical protein